MPQPFSREGELLTPGRCWFLRGLWKPGKPDVQFNKAVLERIMEMKDFSKIKKKKAVAEVRSETVFQTHLCLSYWNTFTAILLLKAGIQGQLSGANEAAAESQRAVQV